MPYCSSIILNSFYNRLFPKFFQHNRRMPSDNVNLLIHSTGVEICATSTKDPFDLRCEGVTCIIVNDYFSRMV